MRLTHVSGFALVLLCLFALFALNGKRRAHTAETGGYQLKLPNDARVERFDFGQKGIENWKIIDGKWTLEQPAAVPSEKHVLMLRPQGSAYNVIVAPGGPYSDVDVSVRFNPISGREDASGGIVFRFSDGRYYVVRANALEDNFRLYYYDQKRYQLATATVKPPALGQWHTLRVVAVSDLIQAYLDGKFLLNHHDSRFHSGAVGLWTKSDSVTAFDDLEIKGAYKSQ
jgi:3-keto-disaccharide hydrolase